MFFVNATFHVYTGKVHYVSSRYKKVCARQVLSPVYGCCLLTVYIHTKHTSVVHPQGVTCNYILCYRFVLFCFGLWWECKPTNVYRKGTSYGDSTTPVTTTLVNAGHNFSVCSNLPIWLNAQSPDTVSYL